jgi:hypothetical protein
LRNVPFEKFQDETLPPHRIIIRNTLPSSDIRRKIPCSKPTVKTLTAILLLLSLVLPAGMLSMAMASPGAAVCNVVVDDSGTTCCKPAAVHCCCDAKPAGPQDPAPSLPLPSSSTSAAKDIAASLPILFTLAELPRLSEATPLSAPFGDRAPFATAPPARLCVLRCCLLI